MRERVLDVRICAVGSETSERGETSAGDIAFLSNCGTSSSVEWFTACLEGMVGRRGPARDSVRKRVPAAFTFGCRWGVMGGPGRDDPRIVEDTAIFRGLGAAIGAESDAGFGDVGRVRRTA